jgi:hypothetical protein
MMKRRMSIAASLMVLAFAVVTATTASSALAVGPTWGAAEWTGTCVEKTFAYYDTFAECLVHSGVLFITINGWDRAFGAASTLTTLTSREASIASGEAEGSSAQKFLDSDASVECSAVTGSGTLQGGEPGTSSVTLKYTGCKVLVKETSEEAKGCSVRSKGAGAGTIEASLKSKLVYIGTKAQAEKEEGPVGDLYTPASGNVYAALEFAGACPTGLEGSHNLEGDSVAEEPTGVQQWSNQRFPTGAITHYFSWESGKVVESTVTRLKVLLFTVTETGTAGTSIKSMLEGLEASPK